LGEGGVVDWITALAPGIEATLQRTNFADAPISKEERRTGARSFVWSSAVEDDFAVVRQPVVLFL
jgi:hypothetical protein